MRGMFENRLIKSTLSHDWFGLSTYTYFGNSYFPPKGTQWKTSYPEGLDRLAIANRMQIEGNSLRAKLYLEDNPLRSINNLWDGIGAASDKIYVVQTTDEIVKRAKC